MEGAAQRTAGNSTDLASEAKTNGPPATQSLCKIPKSYADALMKGTSIVRHGLGSNPEDGTGNDNVPPASRSETPAVWVSEESRYFHVQKPPDVGFGRRRQAECRRL
jgi:hypothetical protein